MQLEILTYCDAATEHAGRLNIVGATDTLLLNSVPGKIAHCAFVMRFRVARIEEGEHAVRVMVIDEDGGSLLNMEIKLNVRINSGMSGAINMIVNAQNLEFPETGEYAVEVAMDGILIGSTPLFIRSRLDEMIAQREEQERIEDQRNSEDTIEE